LISAPLVIATLYNTKKEASDSDDHKCVGALVIKQVSINA